jgi:methionyl-tRNA synthetase
LNVERRKLSKSRRWVIEIPDFLSRYDPDPLRYTLTINAPETSDADFTWEEFLRRNNNELVATWGNLCYRLLVFANRYFGSRVPEPGELGAREQEVLKTIEEGFQKVGQLLDACKFRAALTETMGLAQMVNRYLNEKEPWKLVKEEPASAAPVIYTGLKAVDSLKVLFYPFIPFSSQEIHRMLGYQDDILGRQYVEVVREERKSHLVLRYDFSDVKIRWEPGLLKPGQPIGEPRIPFKKLDEKIVEEEVRRMLALAGETA